tara:strand:+ start:559 stop:741 length:183 start_codon:yes stop_codon:yes gene_type:complete
MATIKQIIVQDNIAAIVPKRFIVQTNDDPIIQTTVNYDDLSTEDKAIYDAFIVMCDSKTS